MEDWWWQMEGLTNRVKDITIQVYKYDTFYIPLLEERRDSKFISLVALFFFLANPSSF